MSKEDVPHLKIQVLESRLEEGAKKILSIIRPNLSLDNVEFKLFTDGITNKLLGCFGPGEVILIRVYGNKTDLLIDRDNEKKNFKLLHKFGLAPKLHATFNNGLVYEYLEGVTLNSESCISDNVYPLVAKRLAQTHSVRPSRSNAIPSLWEKLMRFYNLVPEVFTDDNKQNKRNHTLTDKSIILEEINFLRERLPRLSSRIVFCHNDLLLGNVIYNDKKNVVHFIDYEYADDNYQAFDIANHFNEFAGVETVNYDLYPNESYQRNWLLIYWKNFKQSFDFSDCQLASDEEEIEKLLVQVDQFSLASHLFWGIWALVQAEHSTIDFNFLEYAVIRLQEYFKRKAIIFQEQPPQIQ